MAAPSDKPTYRYPDTWTVADLQAHLCDVPLDRIRIDPKPGFATEEDMLRVSDTQDCLCELIDGVLVTKPASVAESRVNLVVGCEIMSHLDKRKRKDGFVLGPGGPVRTIDRRVRLPDVSYATWNRLGGRELSDEPVLPFSPDLVVETLSKENTVREMMRKLAEYFESGTRLAWYIDLEEETARIYAPTSECSPLGKADELDGSDVLPGFKLRLHDLFEKAFRHPVADN